MAMRKSSLNPYAASYVPFSTSLESNDNKDSKSTQELKMENQSASYGHQSGESSTHGQHQNVSPKSQLYASTSHYPNEKITENSSFNEEYDMELMYLQMTFPDISEDSLSHVFIANGYDLDAAVDMLKELELPPDDSFINLPDSLGIGDVPESELSIDFASPKLKSVSGASTSGSSNLPST